MNQFPGTNYHDLNLDWILEQVKNCLAEWETTKGEWESAKAEINAKIAYINSYFANLDVSEEISDKINAMIQSGELLTIIAPQVATTAQAVTGDWLNAQLVPEGESLVVIDKSLSIEGAAADAKATGFAISKITGAIHARNIVAGSLQAAFLNDNGTYKINANPNERLIYFPVTSGVTYTVNKGSVMSSARLAYSSVIPKIGDTVIDYTDIARQNQNYNSFTATHDGYGIVRIAWANDVVTPEQALADSFVYVGSYDIAVTKYTTDVDNIETINGEAWSELMRKMDLIVSDAITFTPKAYVATGIVGQQADLTVHPFNDTDCAVVDVLKGQPFLLTGTPRDNSGTRAYCWVDSNGIILYRYNGTERLEEYPIFAPADGKLILNFSRSASYRVYSGMKNVMQVAGSNLVDVQKYTAEPLTNLPDYFVNTLAYRPIGGELEKGYICLVTDDGTEGLATYTIPMLIQKNVPFTFAVFKDSEVFQTQAYQTTVLDAVNNHGCALAQHGGTYWDIMTEAELVSFFEEEKQFFDSLNVSLQGAVVPGHRTTTLVKAVAGGRFGILRSGYRGQAPDFSYNDSIQNYYEYWTSGARSNVYGLSSYNISGADDAYNRNAIDYAKANNKILIGYYHEYDLTAEKKAIIESMIDYAKAQGLTFITLGQIATIR